MTEDKGTALLAVPCLMDYNFFKAAINLPDTPCESRLFFSEISNRLRRSKAGTYNNLIKQRFDSREDVFS